MTCISLTHYQYFIFICCSYPSVNRSLIVVEGFVVASPYQGRPDKESFRPNMSRDQGNCLPAWGRVTGALSWSQARVGCVSGSKPLVRVQPEKGT